jgi:hypothetical protein
MSTSTDREKYIAFLEATGMFGKDAEELVNDDIVRSHDMGLFINNKFDEMKDKLDELMAFKSSVREIMQMIGGSIVTEFLETMNQSDEDDSDEQE